MLISPISKVQFAYQNVNKTKYSNNTITNNSSNNVVANNQIAFTGKLTRKFNDFKSLFRKLPETVATMDEATFQLASKVNASGVYVKSVPEANLPIQFYSLKNFNIISEYREKISEMIIKNPKQKINGDIFRDTFSPLNVIYFIDNFPNLSKVKMLETHITAELSIPMETELRKKALESLRANSCLNEQARHSLSLHYNTSNLSLANKMIEEANIEGLVLKAKLLV